MSSAGGTAFGTTKVRTFSEERGGAYRIHVFDTNITDTTKSLRNVRSIGTGSSEYYNIDYSDNTTLRETTKKPLLFDSPIPRPKNFTSISLSGLRRFTEQVNSNSVTISLSATGETFENKDDWLVGHAGNAFANVNITLSGGGTSATIDLSSESLSDGTNVFIAAYVKKANGKVRSKTLTELL